MSRQNQSKIALFWFRRDLRLQDNTALYFALSGSLPVLSLFIFDRDILDRLEDKQDRRVEHKYARQRALNVYKKALE